MKIDVSRDELVRCLTAYQGRHLIVCSRDLFLAQIDTLNCTDEGVSVSGSLLCILSEDPMLTPEILARMINQEFSYADTWDTIVADQGSLFAIYTAWELFYDPVHNDEISRRYSLQGPTPEFTVEAANLITAWENQREGMPTE